MTGPASASVTTGGADCGADATAVTPNVPIFNVGPSTPNSISGTDIDATAAAELAHAFPSGTSNCPVSHDVILATDQNFPDALAASYLAQSLGTGILLTPTDGLSSETAQALRVEGIQTVYVVGGPAAISQTVLNDLVRHAGLHVWWRHGDRLQPHGPGPDRGSDPIRHRGGHRPGAGPRRRREHEHLGRLRRHVQRHHGHVLGRPGGHVEPADRHRRLGRQLPRRVGGERDGLQRPVPGGAHGSDHVVVAGVHHADPAQHPAGDRGRGPVGRLGR